MFDGAISFHTELGAEEMSQFIGKYPFVMSCNYQEQLHCSTVAIDDRKAMFELAEYLIQRGHGRIALITGVAGPSIQRKQGYLDALAQYGIPVRPEYIVEPVRQYGFEYEVGARFCEQFPLPAGAAYGDPLHVRHLRRRRGELRRAPGRARGRGAGRDRL